MDVGASPASGHSPRAARPAPCVAARVLPRHREGLIAVGLSPLVLGATALAQAVIFVLSGSVALLADLIHNFGDAATAIPLAVAFSLRSERAERVAGLFVVAAIFVSACVAGVEAVQRLVSPETPTTSQLSPLRAASAMGGTGWPRSSGRGRGCGSTARLWSLTAITREPTRT
jgi:hypothetical protein